VLNQLQTLYPTRNNSKPSIPNRKHLPFPPFHEVDDVIGNGISQPLFFSWKKKYSGMDAGHLKCLKELEAENARIKRMFADVSLQRDALKDLIEKKL